MARLTAIELAGDACTLARVTVRGVAVTVSAVEHVDPDAYPGGGGFAAALRQSRQALSLPRRARVVLWGVAEGATPKDPAAAAMLEPLVDAGFRIERVVSPCDALAALARVRQPRAEGAIAWLAINRSHVAIVVVRPGALLYAHAFGWDSSVGAIGSQARLLQRYSLVAFLSPEVRRAMVATSEKGVRVEAVITCGDLPDLRSLTMPLIEELDLEVETLDSLDGIIVAPALRSRMADEAPAIRLAVAGAVSRPARLGELRTGSRLWPVALGAAALAAIVSAWWWYARPSAPRPAASNTVMSQPVTAPPTTTLPVHAAPVTPAPVPQLKPPPATRTAAPQTSRGTAPVRAPSHGTASASTPLRGTASTTPPRGTAPAITPPRGTTPAATPSRVPKTAAPAGAHASVPPTRSPGVGAPALLPDPPPNVSTILTSADRRFAMIDGHVVRVGDHVGQRVVTAIDPRWIVLREPSGARIRVGLGGRLIGVERGR